MKSQLGSLSLKFSLFSFFDDFILIYPLYALLFSDSGLSPVQISSLFVVWSITIFLLEIPSGSLADKYPRKNILLLGSIAKLVGFGFWLFWPSYWGYFIGFVFWGVKVAFSSGTKEALVYDELKRVKSLPLYTKVMGKMESLSLLGMITAGFGASALANRGYRFILLFSLVSVVISGLIIFLLPQAPKVQSTGETKYLEYLRDGVKIVFKRPILLFFVLFLGILTGLGAADEYLGLLFREKGLSNSSVALWTGIIYVFGIIGSLAAHRLHGQKKLMEWSLFLGSALLLAAALAPSILAPIIAGLYMMFLYAVGIVFNTYLQEQANDKTRATTTSVGGLLSEMFTIFIIAIIAFGSRGGDYSHGLGLAAASALVLAAGLWLYSKKLKPLS